MYKTKLNSSRFAKLRPEEMEDLSDLKNKVQPLSHAYNTQVNKSAICASRKPIALSRRYTPGYILDYTIRNVINKRILDQDIDVRTNICVAEHE